MKSNWFKHLSIRHIVQILFAAVVLDIGITFMVFIKQLANSSITFISRPAGVEAFLPISALVGLKAWIATGKFDPIHPAGLVIFLAAIILSLLLKRTFCSWICPIGTLSEGLAKIGKKVFGRNFKMPNWLDNALRSLKYIVLFLFILLILFGMRGEDAVAFMNTPYNMLSDVKMLRFFQNLSIIGITVIALLVLLSMLFENFWCRYLCPYGGLLGLFSTISPYKITRDKQSCIQCGKCTASCPNRILVEQAGRVWSPECTGCLTCVQECPVKGTLTFQAIIGRKTLTARNLALGILGLWILIIFFAIVTGHWESKMSMEVYKGLLPLMDQIGY